MRYLSGEEKIKGLQWINEASLIAKESLCHKAKCGTIIVLNGEVIGSGYNAPPLDKESNRMCDSELGVGKPKYDQTCCMHAEWRAIIDTLKITQKK